MIVNNNCTNCYYCYYDIGDAMEKDGVVDNNTSCGWCSDFDSERWKVRGRNFEGRK